MAGCGNGRAVLFGSLLSLYEVVLLPTGSLFLSSFNDTFRLYLLLLLLLLFVAPALLSPRPHECRRFYVTHN